MSQEAMRVVAPALAGVLIGVSWFGVGGVFLAAAGTAVLAALFVAALPRTESRLIAGGRSPFGELVDAVRYVRANSEVGLIALVTVGVVMIGFPYLVFLPTLAEDRYDVGAIGYGVMSAVVGLGAVSGGFLNASFNRGRRPWRTIAWSGAAFGVALVGLGVAHTYPLALVALAAVGASGLLFQTSSQALLLRISPLEYHGRLQSMVVLGFSGFGLLALPIGLLADAVTLRATLAGMGVAVATASALFAMAHRRSRAVAATEIG
jgi:hypothetical protein